MKRLILPLLLLLALAPAASAQEATATARRVNPKASAPATCSADRGEVYFNTTDDKLYRCTAANTWTEVGGGGGLSGLTSGQYLKATGATTAATDGVKRYVALLTQEEGDAPVATVLENSLGGTVVWGRDDPGMYTATLAGVFLSGKAIGFATGKSGANANAFSLTRVDDNTMLLLNDGEFDNNTVSVEILVYP